MLEQLLHKTKSKSPQALAKLISCIETHPPAECLELLKATPTRRIGITGPPGAGKSTLTGHIIEALVQQNKSVGVLSIDPSSPLTGGAVLADRVRYADKILSGQVFVRSVATRGSTGGLNASIYFMLKAFDLFGFDVVLVETAGTGQTECDAQHVVDVLSLVLVPESGDSLQIIKAGLLEVAHHIIVNKADRPGAKALAIELKNLQAKPVYLTTATQGQGVDKLIELYLTAPLQTPKQKLKAEAQHLLKALMLQKAHQLANSVERPEQALQILKAFE